MRTCGGILQLTAFILGLIGIIGGVVTFATPSYGYGSVAALSNSTYGVVLIVGSFISGLILYGFGAALDGLADIHDNAQQTAESSARTLLAADRSAEALERLVIQRRRPDPASSNMSSAEIPVPPKNTVLRQLNDKTAKP